MYSTLILIFLLIGILIVIGLMIYQIISQREESILKSNDNSNQIEKMSNLADEVNSIKEDMISLSTPLGELNRFLGGNVVTGKIGEWSLQSIVQDIMPDGSYELQHMINPQAQDRVDCTVTTADGIQIPIDSKFYSGQFANYQEASSDNDRKRVLRDLRTAILRDARAISEQYIVQNITTNYAILYIPSEKLIDLVHMIDGLKQECFTNYRIHILGPNTLAMSLDHVRIGYDYLKLNETAHKVGKVVREVQVQFSKYDESTEKVEKKLNSAINEVAEMQTRINVLGRKLNDGADYLEEAISEENDG